MRKTAVLICPGRGTYNKPELGYIRHHHEGRADLMAAFDAYRSAQGQTLISELDEAERFSTAAHTRGDNASPLIYTASLLDAQAVSDNYDVAAVTGNSMGWYIALAAAGAVTPMAGLKIVNTMGMLMQETLIGGQTIYPFVDDQWRPVPGKRDALLELIEEIDARADHHLSVSIHLGGMLVLAGDAAGLKAFEDAVPSIDGRYPLRLPNHSAFHSHLQAPVAAEGRSRLPLGLFEDPKLPMIDGRGSIWWPRATDPGMLRAYTLGHQVTETYDFTRAVQVAAKEFAPEAFILTGPGSTLGGAVAQSLIQIGWRGLTSKGDFQELQKHDPALISLGLDDQRRRVFSG